MGERGRGLPTTGTLTWTPALLTRGSYPGVTITASDGQKSATRSFGIHVDKTNQAPILLTTAPQNGRETAEVKFTLAATDVDGDPLTFVSLAPLPAA